MVADNSPEDLKEIEPYDCDDECSELECACAVMQFVEIIRHELGRGVIDTPHTYHYQNNDIGLLVRLEPLRDSKTKMIVPNTMTLYVEHHDKQDPEYLPGFPELRQYVVNFSKVVEK